MKTPSIGINALRAGIASLFAAIGMSDLDGPAPDGNPIKRSNKSSGGGGRRKYYLRDSPWYKGWLKTFGGLAVPLPVELLPDLQKIMKRSFARGPRPDTWHKLKRAQGLT